MELGAPDSVKMITFDFVNERRARFVVYCVLVGQQAEATSNYCTLFLVNCLIHFWCREPRLFNGKGNAGGYPFSQGWSVIFFFI